MAGIQFKGTIAAPFTPLGSNGEINFDLIPEYLDHLLQKEKVNGVFVNGTSGEGFLFSVDERKKLAEKWLSLGKNSLEYIIIHVGAESIKDTQELAKHAQDIGAPCIAVMSPTYYKPPTADAMADYLEEVYKAAPKVPMLYYYIPPFNQVNFSMEALFTAAKDKVPTLIGAKCSSPDLADVMRCLTVFEGKYQVLYGGDGMILGACAHGANSSVGVSFNYAGSTAKAIIENFEKGDLEAARYYQARLQELLKVIQKNGHDRFSLSIHKAVLRLKGVDVGPSRLPMTPVTKSLFDKLKEDLTSIGFWEWTE